MWDAVIGMVIGLAMPVSAIYGVIRYHSRDSLRPNLIFVAVMGFFGGALFDGNLDKFLYPPQRGESSAWWSLIGVATGVIVALIYYYVRKTTHTGEK